MTEDTIAAIATALGEASVAVVRVSGPKAVDSVAALFRGKADLRTAPSHTVHYGWICDPDTGERIDETLVTVMRAPRSYTAEDVVEIGTHGGIVAVQAVLKAVLRQGVRLAEPGEFTKRAFLNGRIDLAQAEAVMDLIRSRSERAFRVARRQMEGVLSDRVRGLRSRLVELLAHVEVNIDYPEHDVPEVTAELVAGVCGEALKEVEDLLAQAGRGKILREGIVTAIVGRPNAGKSSLLNALARENRAIVTDIPGTTRDIVEESVTLSGIPIRLLDTAGIRETEDVVERIGVERTRGALQEADLVLHVIAADEPLHGDDMRLLEELADRPAVIVVNKTDLPEKLDEAEVERLAGGKPVVRVSARDGNGLDRLEEAVRELFFGGAIAADDLTYVSNARHIDLLRRAADSLRDAKAAAEAGMPVDILQIDVAAAWEALGEIVGEAAGEALIDQIFSQFCLGK